MNEDQVIAALAADLRPVQRLPGPVWRAFGWLVLVAALGSALASGSDLPAMHQRLAEAPDLCWATAGSMLTAICAVLAAFELSVPGRSVWWSALPLPPALLWLSASGWGCLRSWAIPGVAPADMAVAMSCVSFIALVSVPLSVALLWMLRRACPLWPGRTAAMAGLAAAAAAASLLTLFHQHDASAVDMLMHVLAVSLVVIVSRLAEAQLA
jgi:hypothetical protein